MGGAKCTTNSGVSNSGVARAGVQDEGGVYQPGSGVSEAPIELSPGSAFIAIHVQRSAVPLDAVRILASYGIRLGGVRQGGRRVSAVPHGTGVVRYAWERNPGQGLWLLSAETPQLLSFYPFWDNGVCANAHYVDQGQKPRTEPAVYWPSSALAL